MPLLAHNLSNMLGQPSTALPHSNSPFVSAYNRKTNVLSSATWIKTPDLTPLPTTAGNYATGCDFDPHGTVLAVSLTVSPYIRFYNRVGDSFNTGTTTISQLPSAASVRGIAWHPNGQFIAVPQETTPYINIYLRNGNTYTRLADSVFGGSLPTGAVRGAAWNPAGNVLALGLNASPWVYFYKFNVQTATFTKISNPATLPTGGADNVDWHPSGNIVTVAHSNSPYMTNYWWDGTTFTKLANPSALPSGTQASTPAWSFNGSYLAISGGSSPYVYIYTVSINGTSSTLTQLPTASTLSPAAAASQGYGLRWLNDGGFMFGPYLTPFFAWYTPSGTNTWALTPQPVPLPAGNINGALAVYPRR